MIGVERQPIIVGRDEIEKFGDGTLGEIIKRLPGVTMDGIAGRGGNIRMRGLGGGFVPHCMARGYIEAGRLVVKKMARAQRVVRVHYAWRETPQSGQGRALMWWLKQLETPATREALLSRHWGT